MAKIAASRTSHGPRRFSQVAATIALFCCVILILERFEAFGLVCDSSCDVARGLWYSGPLLSALFGGSLAFLLMAKNETVSRRVAMFLPVAAVIAFGLMLFQRVDCPLCAVAQCAWLLIGVESTFGSRLAAGLGVCLPLIGVPAYETWRLHGPVAQRPTVEIRPYERFSRHYPNAFIVFTDPCSPACKKAESAFQSERSFVPVIYRWRLDSKDGISGLRLACLIESAVKKDAVKGGAFRKDVFAYPRVPDLRELLTLGAKEGFARSDIESWYLHPDRESEDFVRKDAELSLAAYVDHVPSLGIVSALPGESFRPSVRLLNKQECGPLAQALMQDLSGFNIFFEENRDAG